MKWETRNFLGVALGWKETFSYLSQTTTSQPIREMSDDGDKGSEESSDVPTSPSEPDVLQGNQDVEVILALGIAAREEPALSQGKVIKILYILQVVIECTHYHMKWVGDALEG